VSHDPTEIILMCSFAAQEYLALLSILKTVVLFFETVICFSVFFDK